MSLGRPRALLRQSDAGDCGDFGQLLLDSRGKREPVYDTGGYLGRPKGGHRYFSACVFVWAAANSGVARNWFSGGPVRVYSGVLAGGVSSAGCVVVIARY